jgi:hypothetical protein
MSEQHERQELPRDRQEDKHIQAILDDVRAWREAARIAEQARARAALQERQETLLEQPMQTALTA